MENLYLSSQLLFNKGFEPLKGSKNFILFGQEMDEGIVGEVVDKG